MQRNVITIDLDSPVAFDEQLKRQIKVLVGSRAVRSGQRLPTVRELALDLEINANELSRICRRLEDQGFLLKRRGTGTFAIYLRDGVGSVKQQQEVYDV
jgi:GntR family transcriptional regulator